MSFRKPFDIAYPDLVPIVLAAGASSRMGRPKELLELQGVTCLDRVLGACAEAGLGRPIVVTRAERRPALEAHLEAGGRAATVVVNPRPELGQTSSLRAGLAALPPGARAFLIYPVDYPLVTGDDVARLGAAFTGAPAEVRVVAPSFAGRRGHPVLVAAALAPAILALPDEGSARTVLAAHAAQTLYVPFEDDRALVDMDTPEAYAACLARLAARG